jgi:hypothetical protein
MDNYTFWKWYERIGGLVFWAGVLLLLIGGAYQLFTGGKLFRR